MKVLKKEEGFTLIEIVLVFGIVGILLVLFASNYLSINKTYLKASQKASNLEEARLVMSQLTDHFQRYEAGSCRVYVGESESELEKDDDGKVRKIAFEKENTSATITYEDHQVMLNDQVIASHVKDFTVRRSGVLYDFRITIEQKANKAMAKQEITVGTTVNTQYMKR